MLFQENEMAACLRDIDRATKSGYPDNLVHKLLDRKGKCLMKLGHYSEAIIVLGEAVAKARKNVEEEKKLNLFLSDVQKSLKVCSSKKSGSLPLKGYDKEETGLPMLTGANPQMPAFSKAVEIAHSQKVGLVLAYGICIFCFTRSFS